MSADSCCQIRGPVGIPPVIAHIVDAADHGEGLDEALARAETIIDTATGPSPDQEATAFFTASARNLQRAGAAAGAKRIVVVSIVGIDKFQGGHNAAKPAQERTLLVGPLPVRIARAAQVHEFVEPLVGWTIQDGVAGAALPNPGAKLAGPGFEEWLAVTFAPSASS